MLYNRVCTRGCNSNFRLSFRLFFIIMSQEIWKDIPWYEWLYQVSNLWRIKNRHKILSQSNNNCWYLIISLSKCNKSKKHLVHRLVLSSFNYREWFFVNHKNWIKADNRIENLEWCTRSENMKHAFKIWKAYIWKNNFFKKNNPDKWKFWKNSRFAVPIIQYSISWEFIKEWWSIIDASRELWLFHSSISKCCANIYKSSWWYQWKYK